MGAVRQRVNRSWPESDGADSTPAGVVLLDGVNLGADRNFRMLHLVVARPPNCCIATKLEPTKVKPSGASAQCFTPWHPSPRNSPMHLAHGRE